MPEPLTIESLQAKIAALKTKVDRLNTQAAEAKHRQKALETVLAMYTEKPKRRTAQTEKIHIQPDELRGMDIESALIYIANHNANELASTLARELLVQAEILSEDRRGRNDLWNALKASKRFQNVSRGRYVLVTDTGDEGSSDPARADARYIG